MSCFKQLQFSPKELTRNVKRESSCHKAKVVGWSAFMVMIAGAYLTYFSDVTSRSSQLQNLALAGQLEFNEYEPYDAVKQFNFKVLHDLYEQSDMKDLKYIQMGWVNRIDPENFEAIGPQDDNQLFYTQTNRFTEFDKLPTEPAQRRHHHQPAKPPTPQEKIDADAKKYKEWETMHGNVIWFDTAGCQLSNALRSQYGVIGDSNLVAWAATAPWFHENNAVNNLGWYIGDKENPAPFDGWNVGSWNTNVQPLNPLAPMLAPKIDLADDFRLMKRNLKHLEDMADCDMECQAKGSQLTLVAILNDASLSLIVLNGLLGIWGGWSYIGRTAQTYCTFFTFLFQMAILIACGTMLFTPYAMQCYGSLFPTTGRPDVGGMSSGSSLWTMHDDYVMVVGLWASQWVWLFIFLVIGLCGTFRSEEGQPAK